MNPSFQKHSVTLLQGIFKDDFFARLSRDGAREVVVLEGRPSLESSRATIKQLLKHKIKPTLIADNMAGFLFFNDLVKEVRMSYQIADQNGAVCRIGGLILGILARTHKVDVNVYPQGSVTPLMGKEKSIFEFNGEVVAPKKVKGYVPLAEWVPKKYITNVYREEEI